jgi:putative protein kinase ArgK-like GTPase of G3E family
MTKAHRKARAELDHRLDAEWQQATKDRTARLPRGVRGLWHRITGKYQELRAQGEREAQDQRRDQEAKRQALIDEQREVRAKLQESFKALRKEQADRLRELRADIGRFWAFSKSAERSPDRSADREASRAQGRGLGLSLKR